MSTDPSTRSLLDALLSGQELPAGLPADQVARTRQLAQDIGSADPAEVEALAEPLALAILDAAVRARAAHLAEALSRSGRKPLAKAAKRALYQLRSAGVALAPPPAPAPSAPSPSRPAGEELPSLLSAITGTGERAAIVARPIRGGGLELFQVIVSDELGVVHLTRGAVSRNEYRRQLKELRRSTPASIEVGTAALQELLADAAFRNLSRKTAFPPGTDELLRFLQVKPQEHRLEVPPPSAEDLRLALQAHQLHDEPEIAPWLPPESELKAMVQRIDEVQLSPLQLTEVQRREQVSQIIRSSAERFLTPEIRQLYARRLWGMAEVFEATGRARQGEIARAEARTLLHSQTGSRFIEFLFEKVLLLSEMAKRGQPMPAPGERLTPAAPPPEEKRSPGGLILP